MFEQTVFAAQCLAGASPIFMARIYDNDGTLLTRADVASIAYKLYEDDPADASAEDGRGPVVANHNPGTFLAADVIFDTLQTDVLWEEDATGYNFKAQLDVSVNGAFTLDAPRYFLEVTITPNSGQAIKLAWRVSVL